VQRDGHIRLLPLHVANKIAAGEVVERPASVLKELVENALDAGATRIDTTVVAGGRTLVSVRDNGCGMTREDALLSLERQATSKIRDVDDIENIDTLGFRGEAIPSIAAVSRFTLTTRRAEDESGTRLVVNAGTLAEVADCGAPPGTCVEVRDLFCNVPARRKFLRSYATEEAHIRSVMTVHALAHPDIGFSLTIDGREAYRFAPGATLEERIRAIFGASFADSLLPVSHAAVAPSGIRIHGYIERLGANVDIRHEQFTFVNGRPATAPVIGYALREACPHARADTRPSTILFIDLPPSQVDVNVHPSKREVRFRKAAEVKEALTAAVTGAFLSPVSVPAAPAPAAPAPKAPVLAVAPALEPSSFTVPFSTIPNVAPARPDPVPVPPEPESAPIQQEFAEPRQPDALWRWFNVLAETSTGYLLVETDDGLVTLNPRAARERIAYENVLARKQIVSQPLLLPETVQLSPADSQRIRGFLDELSAIGFVLEEFGRDVWKLDAVPQLAAGIPAAKLLASIASDIAESGTRRGTVRWRDELVARSIARTFAGASVKLTPEGATQLVKELAATRQPYVCPRGRPIMIYTSNGELSRKFAI